MVSVCAASDDRLIAEFHVLPDVPWRIDDQIVFVFRAEIGIAIQVVLKNVWLCLLQYELIDREEILYGHMEIFPSVVIIIVFHDDPADLPAERRYRQRFAAVRVKLIVFRNRSETRYFHRVKLPLSGAERAAALGSEAKRNGDGRAQYYFSRSQRVLFRISLFHRLADRGISETT